MTPDEILEQLEKALAARVELKSSLIEDTADGLEHYLNEEKLNYMTAKAFISRDLNASASRLARLDVTIEILRKRWDSRND